MYLCVSNRYLFNCDRFQKTMTSDISNILNLNWRKRITAAVIPEGTLDESKVQDVLNQRTAKYSLSKTLCR